MNQEIEALNYESPDLDIGSEVILMDQEIIEEYVVDETSGDLQVVTTEKCAGKGDAEKIKEGTFCVIREEGSLFPGRIKQVKPLKVSVLQKNFLGGWSWPSKVDICQIDESNIISILKEQQLSKKGGQIYIDDDILFMEWGE